MTKEEKAKEIIKQDGGCKGIDCDIHRENECPIYAVCGEIDGDNSPHPAKVSGFLKFLEGCGGAIKTGKHSGIIVGNTIIGSNAMPEVNPAASKYNRPITGLDGTKTTVDVYRVLVAFSITDPELQHSLKKLLNLGIRGKGDYTQDLDEAILSLQKMKERKEQECK